MITLGIVVITIIAAMYYYSSDGTPAAPGDIEISVLSPEEQQRLAEFRKIKNLSFDMELLNDPFLKSLQDVQVPPGVSEPVGRPNPFLPF